MPGVGGTAESKAEEVSALCAHDLAEAAGIWRKALQQALGGPPARRDRPLLLWPLLTSSPCWCPPSLSVQAAVTKLA